MSENEPIKSYDVPAPSGDLDIDQVAAAKSQLSKMDADIAGDSLHPYMTKTHSQHKEFVAARERLHKVASPQPEPQTNEAGEELVQQLGSAATKVMADGLKERENQDEKIQAGRTEQAQAEMDKLVEAGYERGEIPDDISARQLEVMKMQRLNAEGCYRELDPLIAKNLRNLQVPAKLQTMYSDLATADNVDETLRSEVTETILGWINEARKQKEGK